MSDMKLERVHNIINMNDTDMSEMSPLQITETLSSLYGGHLFVWEYIEDWSIQFYTMKHPVDLGMFSGTKEGWYWWRDIEVYTKNFKPGTEEFKEIALRTEVRVFKGLI